ncbi:thioredoxin domain-containing protein [Cellulomonas sp. RIT-PI-Y]|uniref:DsbA family protein n=1 Tax=Cellulomonas sp. RIT-PI-Y TaxID=3035297 RepID=UPI0021DAB576|nr:thioredoxin domain-containing protein [Cellulomonas sp. RIT-PI-Y]
MSSNSPKPSKAERRDQAREQARAMREAQRKRDQRNKFVAIGAVVVAVLALGGVGGWLWVQSNQPSIAYAGDDVDTIALADTTAPSTAADNGGIPVGQDGVAGEAEDGNVVVSVYSDYMCPICGQFEEANASELETLRKAGGVTIEYHLLSFLDSQSRGADYSTRSGNAAAVVADQAPEQFVAFSAALFEDQPEEGTKGLSDSKIADLARSVGVPDDVIAQFTTTDGDHDWRTFAPWLQANVNEMRDELGQVSTPTILINGERFEGELFQAGPLTEAIEAAMN